MTAQLTELGMLCGEYERGYDWFHQGESNLLLYFLCMAAPARWAERAVRFAELYVDPAHGNYDPVTHIIRGAHNGSDPAAPASSTVRITRGWRVKRDPTAFPSTGWCRTAPRTRPGPGPAADQRNGRPPGHRRHGHEPVSDRAHPKRLDPDRRAALPGLDRRYVTAWIARTVANDGIVPDNAGPDGVVGSLLGGRWYGGHYGWSWPHGWYSIGQAATVGALAAATVTGDQSYLDLVRTTLDALIEHGKVMPFTESDSSIPSKWYPQLGSDAATPTLLVPFRHSDRGWFDYNPMLAAVPMMIWHYSTALATSGAWKPCAVSRVRLEDRAPVPQQGRSRS